MGALSSNRKRGDDYCTLNYKSPSLRLPEPDRRADIHIAKKLKLAPSMRESPERLASSKSAASRIYRYPEPVNRLRRAVHAPCRASRLGFSLTSKIESRRSTAGLAPKEGVASIMGNVLSFHYDRAKNRALQSLWCWRKDKEVIDVDAETVKDDVLEDSSIEEVEAVENGHEGRSVLMDRSSQRVNGAEPISQELDAKIVGRNLHPSSSSVVSDLTNANLKIESAEKLLESLSIDREVDDLGIPLHKKLLEIAERRNPKLGSLNFQIELHEKHRARFQLLRPVRKQELEEDILGDKIRELFDPLTEEEETEICSALSNSNRRKLLAAHENSNIEITGETLQCLRPGAWLNDEVINLYLELLKERERREPNKFLKCHFFNTFFYKKLFSGRDVYDFKSVRRWTTLRKLGYHLLDCDKIFVPVHKEIHWCLAVINKKDKKFQYLDSLGGIDKQVLNILAKYYVDEVKDKSGKGIDVSTWKQEFVEDLPEQENGYDCGVFMIKYADFYSRGLGLCFNQEHMLYFRQRTAKEILRLKAE